MAFLTIMLLLSCDREIPELPGTMPLILKLHYETDLPVWNQDYSLQAGVTSRDELRTKSVMATGRIRYLIRTYPLSEPNPSSDEYEQEFVFTEDIQGGYDREFELDLKPGEYKVVVWSDLKESESSAPFYECDDFSGISFYGEYSANNDYRDAFRGYADISITAASDNAAPESVKVKMQRPVAKFEFIATDLEDFIVKEQARVSAKSGADQGAGSVISLEDYRVVFLYPEYLPSKYSLFLDKTVDSSTGVRFDSGITRISGTEASIGFDYVFTNSGEGAVKVQIGLYDRDGKQLSLTKPIDVPLKRNVHSVLRGSFLKQNAPHGITIDSDYDEDFNVYL